MPASELEGPDAQLIARLLRNPASTYSGAEPAGQHRRALLEQADARRLYGVARARTTQRGAGIRIRSIRAYDAVRLAPGFGRLLRSSPLAERGQHDDGVLVAVRSDGSGVGVGGYVRDRNDAASAELEVTVLDGWRCRGIATRLVTRLSDRARAEGVTRFRAVVPAESVAAHRLLAHVPGVATRIGRDTYRIDLDAGAC